MKEPWIYVVNHSIVLRTLTRKELMPFIASHIFPVEQRSKRLSHASIMLLVHILPGDQRCAACLHRPGEMVIQ